MFHVETFPLFFGDRLRGRSLGQAKSVIITRCGDDGEKKWWADNFCCFFWMCFLRDMVKGEFSSSINFGENGMNSRLVSPRLLVTLFLKNSEDKF
ncbi:hypothetical protein NIES208_04540 [[Limnothrix rosea] IAM M-220]|nr:hypothetical protein NIES208_04540 [[Limnothrix rosea] IAM M-220]